MSTGSFPGERSPLPWTMRTQRRPRFRQSAYGVTRKTTTRLAKTLGLSETQVVHVALANLARQTLPRYEPDDGPLTQKQMDQIRRMQPPGRMKVKKSLF